MTDTLALAHTITEITRLPAAPTHDWCTSAAKALQPLAPTANAGFVVAHFKPDRTRLVTESTGVSNPTQPGSIDLSTTLERLESIPFAPTPAQLRRGLVAPLLSLFPSWTRQTQREISDTTLAAVASITNTDQPLVILAVFDTPESASPPNPIHAATALAMLAHQASNALHSKSSSINWLTEREGLILERLILGHSVRVIAEELDRSPHTVHDHVKNLHRKLGATSRGQLIAIALGRADQTYNQTPDLLPLIVSTRQSLAEIKPVATARVG